MLHLDLARSQHPQQLQQIGADYFAQKDEEHDVAHLQTQGQLHGSLLNRLSVPGQAVRVQRCTQLIHLVVNRLELAPQLPKVLG